MQLQVTHVEMTKSGKGYWVSTNQGKFYSKAKGVEQCVGKVIDAIEGEFSTPGRPPQATIDAFTVVSGAVTGGASYAPQTASAPVVDRFYMPFVSNTVAQAILSGKIESPDQIFRWAMAAKSAAEAIEKPQDSGEPDF